MSRMLLTGFEPFRTWTVNSSWEAVRRLAPSVGAATLCLPVDHRLAAEALGEAVARHRPARLLMAGLAPTPAIRVEGFGRPGPLAPWAAALRRARWPVGPSLMRLRAHGLPAVRSADAGAYVCDTTYWHALGLDVGHVVFVHVPPIGPQWPVARIARALGLVLSAAEDSLADRSRRPAVGGGRVEPHLPRPTIMPESTRC